jgi:hypothetical protein
MSSDPDHRVPNLRFRLPVSLAAFVARALVALEGAGFGHRSPLLANPRERRYAD